ncbi:MAG: sialate O-acetylesterase [Bacteroidales bacterium]|nr:sialate O-acetylesterase [Bacteroidales bacterium]
MRKYILPLALALIGTIHLDAKVTLPSFFSDNMVLQRNTEAAIWGWTDTGGKVTITTTWTGVKFTATPDADGKWITRIPTPEAGGPYKIFISDGDKSERCELKNVLIGEVWFCSGQSNMEMPVRGYGGQPAAGGADMIIKAKAKTPIRICNITRKASLTPLQECEGSWMEHTPEAVAPTSATAYFFASKLQEILDIPVGIIVSCWGGSTIETWMSRETLASKFGQEFDLSFLDGSELKSPQFQTPCTLFNGQVAPLVPFSIGGMIWYQGEANRGRCEQYIRLQKAYVEMMRDLFESPDAPFYFVQIAPYPYGEPDGWTSGYFCEAQRKSVDVIPNSGMAATVDIGEFGTIHPCKKQEVGNRLAYLALVKHYGFKGINPESPSYESVKFENGEAVVTFKMDDRGLSPGGVNVEGFEIAGADKVFHPASAHVELWNNKVVVSSPDVPDPVAVRYCFRNWGVGTLFNNYGIPVGPFRTDDWNL